MIFMKFDIERLLQTSVQKIQFWLKSDKSNGHFIWVPIWVFARNLQRNPPRIYRSENMFRTKTTEKNKACILSPVRFSSSSETATVFDTI
jgi:hypothetical protein